ncbi:MAG: DUF1343 domain-containing protein [Bacteroidales bacterium]|nr:DUF1343 domain-containing protein [Bacteroidales bacterium]MCI1785129.1 DUF1343 domain-containing protein [Bacteroidales bacterium]
MKLKSILLSVLSFSFIAGPLYAGIRTKSVIPGIEVLETGHFKGLEGKRVGLVTNPSGVDRHLRSTIDILYAAPQVNLVALFGPEHGVRGAAYAGSAVSDSNDPGTGLPVYSIFGSHREPTPEMLKGIDVMVYDIQDIGSRSYTFISTLGLVMRACAKQGIEVMVLDRPNPLGGNKVEGSVVEPGFYSFVSEFRIPYVYGLTVGELATMINEEGLNRGMKGDEMPLKCKLKVVPMKGWHRDMLYSDTGLPWILPSPNIPSDISAISYPSAGICGEFMDYLNIGIGYTIPFQTFAAQWINADSLKTKLDSYDIPGVEFRVIHYSPFAGNFSGKMLNGVQYFYTDYDKATITLTQFYVMQAVNELYPDHNPFAVSSGRERMFDIVCGTDFVRKEFSKRLKVSDISGYWNKDAASFKAISKKYYMYD